MSLDRIGARLLPWLDEQVLPVAVAWLEEFQEYVKAWRGALDV